MGWIRTGWKPVPLEAQSRQSPPSSAPSSSAPAGTPIAIVYNTSHPVFSIPMNLRTSSSRNVPPACAREVDRARRQVHPLRDGARLQMREAIHVRPRGVHQAVQVGGDEAHGRGAGGVLVVGAEVFRLQAIAAFAEHRPVVAGRVIVPDAAFHAGHIVHDPERPHEPRVRPVGEDRMERAAAKRQASERDEIRPRDTLPPEHARALRAAEQDLPKRPARLQVLVHRHVSGLHSRGQRRELGERRAHLAHRHAGRGAVLMRREDRAVRHDLHRQRLPRDRRWRLRRLRLAGLHRPLRGVGPHDHAVHGLGLTEVRVLSDTDQLAHRRVVVLQPHLGVHPQPGRGGHEVPQEPPGVEHRRPEPALPEAHGGSAEDGRHDQRRGHHPQGIQVRPCAAKLRQRLRAVAHLPQRELARRKVIQPRLQVPHPERRDVDLARIRVPIAAIAPHRLHLLADLLLPHDARGHVEPRRERAQVLRRVELALWQRRQPAVHQRDRRRTRVEQLRRQRDLRELVENPVRARLLGRIGRRLKRSSRRLLVEFRRLVEVPHALDPVEDVPRERGHGREGSR